MTFNIRPLAALVVAGVLLSGCAQAAEQLTESATGTDIEMNDGGVTITDEQGGTLTVEEDGSTTYTDEESGTVIESGGDVSLPPTYPGELPVPANGTLVSALENGKGATAMWSFAGLSEEEFDAFVSSVKGAGYATEVSSFGADPVDGSFTKSITLSGNGWVVSISGVGDAEMGQIALSADPES